MILARHAILLLLAAPALLAQNPFDIPISALQMTSGASPVFLAGTAGGLFRSDDEMLTWTAIPLSNDFARPQPGISQIEIDPSRSNAFFAADSRDGHRNFRFDSRENGVRIYRSDDNGATWTPKTAGLPAEGSLQKIYVIRSQPGTLYAYVDVGNDKRVYKSTDRAESWALLRTIPSPADLLLIHPSTPALWYYETGRAIFISRDEGATWTGAGTFPIRQASGGGLQNTVTEMVANPDDDSTLLMATTGPVFGSEEFLNGVFFSGNQGSSWQRVINSNAHQLHIERGVTIVYHVEGARLWVSPDGGRTFGQDYDLYESPRTANAFLVDRRPDGPLYSGLLRSHDSGRTWTGVEATVTPLIGSPDGPIEITASTNDIAPRTERLDVQAFGSISWDLDFTVESSEPWLQADPSSGTTRALVNLTVTAGGLAVGVHQATLTIRSQNAVNAAAEIPVTLTVTDEPAPEPTPTILTFAGDGDFDSDGNGGPAVEASLESPEGLAIDAEGGVLIADNFADVVRRVSTNGTIDAFAGSGVSGFSGDGGPALQAQFNGPQSVAAGPDGTVFIADRFNRRVRAVAPDGTISTYFGNGEFGSFPNQGNIEDLRGSFSVLAAAPDGTLYASGSGTLRITTDGAYQKWNSRSYSGLAVGPTGTVYGVRGNQLFEIRPNNFERLVAGQTEAGFEGDGGPAEEALFSQPSAVAVDADGRIFVADGGNDAVRVIETDGTIRTYAGTGIAGFSGDGGPANLAQIDDPEALAVGPEGELYIAENRRVRVVLPPGSGPPAPVFTSAGIVSAASFAGTSVAPDQIVSIFGANFGSQVVIATETPLPDTLGGVRVELIDSAGATHRLLLFFVAPGQINALIPAGAALGQARLRVVAPGEVASEAAITVEAVSPGLFSANANGAGIAAAAAIRVAADGTQTPVEVLQGAAPVQGRPIDLGPEGDQVVLLLFGTGFRGFGGSVEVTIDGVPAQVLGIAPQPQFVGLDQLNVIIPRELIGRGEVEVRVTIDGRTANVVTIVIG